MSLCHCAGCGADFTAVHPFDRHQSWTDGTLTCTDLASDPWFRVIRWTKAGVPLWGQAERRQEGFLARRGGDRTGTLGYQGGSSS